jgi:hypothetical protein
MPDVLIRNVPPEDLQVIRDAADERGISVQAYLQEVMHAQAAYVRRQDALGRIRERLEGSPGVPEGERSAVLQTIADENDRRGQQLGNR